MKSMAFPALAALVMVAPVQAQAGADAVRWYFGASAAAANIVSPFAWRCDTEVAERATVAGLEGHAAVVTGRVDFAVRLSAARELPVDCPAVGRVRGDGLHVVDHHSGEVDGDWMHAGEVSAGFSPSRMPFLRTALGVGWVRGADAPFATTALGVRLGDRIRFLGDVAVQYSSTPYLRVEEQWRDGEVVARGEVGKGRSWAAGPVLRAGIETTFR
jgi:hypothetical protein